MSGIARAIGAGAIPVNWSCHFRLEPRHISWAQISMPGLILPETVLRLETRARSAIEHRLVRRAPIAGTYEEDLKLDLAHPEAKRRNVGPCNTYNCHGLTFGSRRAGITVAGVAAVLEEDEYTKVDKQDVLPGDIAIYFSTAEPVGDIEHSGLVVEAPDKLGNIKIVSKWGYGDERVHFVPDCPYDATNVLYFRINDCPRFTARRPFTRPKRIHGS
jgi:hypothetical protein